MSSETAQSKVQVSSQQQNKQSGIHCPISDAHINRKEVERISRECRNESFWYRGLPLSLGSMLITQGLIYNETTAEHLAKVKINGGLNRGFLSSNPRFGSLPKIAFAGAFGLAIGTMSYIRVCQRKFQNIGVQQFGPEHKRHCRHICKECEANFASNGRENSKPSAS
ncbi:OCIA domain-containing protein 2 isoform X1 [Mauremys reevesii]|uniref:OCIA domain-containing protein 2 isoform X1 n=1 Tax=Mauremys reevesii TaxID=260615 RepID=UPI00193F5795|nr:OCIA domain-containing protein 2 isoform X1 [Mauremys reevesii]XP_039397627.1 OCIA domain-containing protein 2 isoform X1 [Mauremys reevesii]XP_039397628.1 OCIA domain-containing protein 2 isoform X1 [Mauremys reevesii]XP_039397629.1 OCIA domain-containing protein 2 isoform X1 [Mauremys reevesii]XP_039397630.1 OCIA domain-containing protein 2 isoform X1 [Mauremys reevesii]XP_039397631.1 OCIA domain-containing protein 2 isoform X1 [Mauremys reevesii]XP_039397632.1 OCIA domain-containing pro